MSIVTKKPTVDSSRINNAIPIAMDGKTPLFVDYEADDENPIYSSKNKDLTFYPHIPKNQRMSCYISGISGSGKSTKAAEIANMINKQHNDKLTCYFITSKPIFDGAGKLLKKEIDPAIQKVKKLVPVNMLHPAFYDIHWTEFSQCIIIFDDHNTMNKKSPEYKFVMNLLETLLKMSRKNNVHIICINHQTRNYNETRVIIDECSDYCVFPRSNGNSVMKFLKSYVTEDKKILAKVAAIRGPAWTPLYIRKVAPSYIMTNEWIELL